MRYSIARFGMVAAGLTAIVLACSSDSVTDPNTPIGLQLSIAPATDTIFITDTLTGAETAQLSVSATSQGQSIPVPSGRIFESQDPSVATVDSATGLVHARTVGTADVFVRVNGVRAHATIVVAHPTSRVLVTPATLDILEDNAFGPADTARVHAQAFGADGKALAGVLYTFTSSDTSVAVIDAAGKVTARKVGISTITSTANGLTGTATVHAVRAARSLTVKASADSIFVDNPVSPQDTLLFQPIARDSLGNVRAGVSLTFSTSDPSVATVSSAGVITARSLGTATISAAGADMTTSATVNVLSLAKSVTLSPPVANGLVGDTVQLTAAAMGWHGTALTGRTYSYSVTGVGDTISQTGRAALDVAGQAIATATTAFTTSNAITLMAYPREFVAGAAGSISSGGDATCGLLPLNRTYCFGTAPLIGIAKDTACFTDVTDDLSNPRPCTLVPLRVAENLQFKSVSVGDLVACATDMQDHAYCWGDQRYGETGDGIAQTGTAALPAPVTGPTTQPITLRQISAGHAHACGVDPSGQAFCWGEDSTFQLGGSDGKRRINSSTPIPVWLGTTVLFTSISAGGNHTCALSNDGTAYCWGLNMDGQLGRGTSGDSSDVPTPVNSSVKFIQLSAGFRHTCGLTQSQSIYCWGANDSAQAGQPGGQARVLVPTQVAGAGYTALAAGASHTCALVTGTAFCWGKNDYGQLGRGPGTANNPAASPVPMAVQQGSLLFSNIAAGRRTTCAIAADGAYCWGSSVLGAMGDNLQALSIPFPRKTAVPQ